AIARAIASKPSMILEDEPTGNLDTASSHDVLGLLKAVAGRFKQTVVLITHDQDIAQLSDRIVHIEDTAIFVMIFRLLFSSIRITSSHDPSVLDVNDA
ncbi:hypothetical protein NE611_17860, partial [Anaerostipes caccae]|nr:hypothetical protein [Anaerostipes caccae]